MFKHLKAIWLEENDRTFYGRLTMPRFYLANLNQYGWYGYHEVGDNFEKIVLHYGGFRWTTAKIREILIHEMIHQLQAQAKSKRTRNEQHGRFFQYHHIRIFGVKYK